MRKLKLLLIPIISIFLLQSCDEVTQYYEEDVTFNPERKVLIEDYTGHKCGNCPRATRSAYDLKNIYGENLIIIAVHAGFFAQTNPPQAPFYTYDFRNSVSTDLDNDFGVSLIGNPNGMVNRRTNSDGSNIFAYTSWADEANKVLFDFSQVPASITINNSYDDATRALETKINTEIYVDLPSSYRISAYLVEDHIENWQKDYDVNPDNVEFYIHREVLRGSLNGTYGDKVNAITAGSTNSHNYTFTIDAEFVAEECSIVAFIYDESTNEIIEVEQVKIQP